MAYMYVSKVFGHRLNQASLIVEVFLNRDLVLRHRFVSNICSSASVIQTLFTFSNQHLPPSLSLVPQLLANALNKNFTKNDSRGYALKLDLQLLLRARLLLLQVVLKRAHQHGQIVTYKKQGQ